MNYNKFNKFNLCVLPTQMGKTFIIINHIKENLLNDITEGRSLHIVFTMNTLLNNKQFSNRLECINNDYGTNSICVFSSIYKGPYGHANNFTNLVFVNSVFKGLYFYYSLITRHYIFYSYIYIP